MSEEKKEGYLPLWEPLDKTKEVAPKKELTPAELAEKRRKQRETEAWKKKYFEYYDDIKISHREDWQKFNTTKKEFATWQCNYDKKH